MTRMSLPAFARLCACVHLARSCGGAQAKEAAEKERVEAKAKEEAEAKVKWQRRCDEYTLPGNFANPLHLYSTHFLALNLAPTLPPPRPAPAAPGA